ncbi:hypothetical protein EUTSA_v10023090mg [Eutrema salsugineum]|uniref:Uncharacterized protein n=1 Tax=Eutrema salsugineum TaxID=72664 RepID=V4LJ50_EUTSA|nr:uncharacterized protein LOC18025799 [Eutrema salsugineum]ESQ50520.1 hypothetical protein EUTSA_v10023090mg [Eutrema salsugineum]
MEATKERMEKEQNKKREESSVVTNEAGKAEDVVRAIIRDSIVEGGGDGEGDGGDSARKPEDILAFSRTVRKIDSSLE